MEYEKMDDKAPITGGGSGGGGVRQVAANDFRQNEEIITARRIVLVLLSLQLIFALFYLIQQCIALGQYYDLPRPLRDDTMAGSLIGNVVAAVISVVYLIIFIVVVAKYLRIPILVLAWLGIIQFICALVVFILSIIAAATISDSKYSFIPQADAGIAFSIVIIVLSFLSCVFIIVTVIYAFKLARLIKMQEAYQHV